MKLRSHSSAEPEPSGKAHSFAWSMASVQSDGPKLTKQVLVELEPEVARRTAENYEWAEYSTDWKEVIKREDIDVIDITTPPHTHSMIARMALQHGKHVICEKPIANAPAEVEELSKLAATSTTVTQVGFNYRHSAAVKLAKEIIESGKIGRVINARFEYLQDAAFAPIGWRSLKASGGSGASGDVGSHIIDLANYLVGRISSITAKLINVKMNDTDDHDVDDAGSAIAQFASGGLGTFSFSQKAWGHNNHIRFEIDGTLGSVSFDWNRRDELEVFVKSDEAKGFTTVHVDGNSPGAWFDLNGVGSGYLESSSNQVIDFVKGIRGEGQNAPTFADGAYVQRVIDAIWKSDADGSGWVEVSAD